MIALPILPVLVCLVAAILQLLFAFFTDIRRILHVVSGIALLVITVCVFQETARQDYLVMQAGNYPAPFGITFVIDAFSAILLVLTALIGLAVAVYSLTDEDILENPNCFYPVYWVLLAGICGAFSTGDLFNLYVWFEVILISSFVLMTLVNRKSPLDGTLKYMVINLISTVLMLSAIEMLYGMTGTLNLAEMSLRLNALDYSAVHVAVVVLLCFAFAIKAALFPLYFWLPASYHTINVPSSALFAGMLSKVGIYALIRVMTLLFVEQGGFLQPLLLGCAALTMLTGVLGAASRHQIRRILAFHSISQIGYIAMGLAIFTPLSLTGSVFYTVHHGLVKTNLFLISGVINRMRGSFDLDGLGGLYKTAPVLSFLFFISAFSLAGFPPFSGFWGKLVLLQSALMQSEYWVAMIALGVSFLTLYSMSKIWNRAFWKELPVSRDNPVVLLSGREKWTLFGPVIFLTGWVIAISFVPSILYEMCDWASAQLLNQEDYIKAVLGRTE